VVLLTFALTTYLSLKWAFWDNIYLVKRYLAGHRAGLLGRHDHELYNNNLIHQENFLMIALCSSAYMSDVNTLP
jgi:hypothetical protein